MYDLLKKSNIPMASHYFVNRNTPEITQEYLEGLGERQKYRGEEVIKKAKEWRAIHQTLRSQPMSPFSGEREEFSSSAGPAT